MNLRQFQVAAADLAALAWPDEIQDPARMDAELGDKLSEEVGELAKVCRYHMPGRKSWTGALAAGKATTDDQVLDEVGDVLFVLARRAALHGIDLGAAADRALAKFQARLKDMGIKFRQMTMEEMVAGVAGDRQQAEPLSGQGEHKRLRTYLESIRAAPAGSLAKGTLLECICPGCRTRNQLATAALEGEPVETIDEIVG